MFNAGIDHVANLTPQRRGEDGAIAECARTQLKPVLEPSNDPVLREVKSDTVEKFGFVKLFELEPGPDKRAAHLVRAVGRSIKRMRHFEPARLAKRLVIVPERAAKRRARVGGAWRHPYAAALGIAQDARLGDAGECHATGSHEIPCV